jgi:Flp pilus assembly protein TadG
MTIATITDATREESGQSMVEFVLVAPVLLTVVIGLVQFGIMFQNYVEVAAAARAGARIASVGRVNGSATAKAGATTEAQNAAKDLDKTKLKVTVTSSWAQGSPVTVTVTYPYSLALYGMPVSSGTLSSSTTMRLE